MDRRIAEDEPGTIGAALAFERATFAPLDLPVLIGGDGPQDVRWTPGERLHHVFEAACDRHVALDPDHPAVLGPAGRIGLAALDARANRLARHLRARGVVAGGRVAILLDRSPEVYVALLAISKAGAAYVPLDPGFPAERLRFILEDAGVGHAVVSGRHVAALAGTGVAAVDPAAEAEAIAAREGARLAPDPEAGEDGLAYVIYTSGSTGRPKGVPIRHSMIVNFLRVAVETYGIRADDRVYQGLTIAFDFSVEEILVPLCAGAALVPAPASAEGGNLLGRDLSDFLLAEGITALCCVPTVLATLDEALPALRFILVSGEACPKDLVLRWWAPGRVMLNAYGPTETTVTATITPLAPDAPVTIGRPLPTYGVLILSEDGERALPFGETGEIAVSGIGVAEGYLNRPDQTARAFVPDRFAVPGNVSGRLYRTGDLGRVTPAGEVEYLGRIDTQVKIRGYRIELAEVESVLMKVPAVAQAVVDTYAPRPGEIELAAFVTWREGFVVPPRGELHAQLLAELPSYMVPAFIEPVEAIPLLASGKADRKSLPRPGGRRLGGAAGEAVPPATPEEAAIANALCQTLGLDAVSVTDHIFDALGANSLLVAKLCARLRGQPFAAGLSMRDVYLHPTVRALAAHLAQGAGEAPAPVPAAARRAPHVASRAAYLGCGAAQLGLYALYLFCVTWLYADGVAWVAGAADAGALYARAVLFQSVAFLALVLVPVAVKWLVVGRWTPGEIPIWSLGYLRFWAVKTLVRINPAVAFAGTPLFNLYLRLLGARIGRGVLVFPALAPVASDLLEIGEEAIVHKHAYLSGYRAEGGRIEIGPIAIGPRAEVGENAVVDIHTRLGADCDLAHASTLARGQSVPDGRSVHGSPAVETPTRFRAERRLPRSPGRVAAYTAFQLATLAFLTLPLPLVAAILAYRAWAGLGLDASLGALAAAAEQVVLSLVLFSGLLVGGFLAAVGGSRLLARVLPAERDYPLFGLHDMAARALGGLSSLPVYHTMFGDSSFILHYLKGLGYRLSLAGQTGSNFGLRQRQDAPHLCEIGEGTMVSDGLTQCQFVPTPTSFRLRRTRIGHANFVGNAVLIPPGARTGDNVLLATKVLVPVDGPVRENVGLLGSPAFEIPRSVRRDHGFDFYKEPGILKARLALKRASNLRTIGLFLLTRWLVFALWCLAAPVFLDAHDAAGAALATLALLGLTLATGALAVFNERAARGFRPHVPQMISIYDAAFWRHERYWKLNDSLFFNILNGTPFKNLAWRALGVTWGRMNFDDGCSITERSLVRVGDGVTLGEQATIQSHSLEDGTFKSDVVRIGSGATIGAKAYVSYGADVGEGATIAPDAFVMKGESLAPGSLWSGNPAREVGAPARALAATPDETLAEAAR